MQPMLALTAACPGILYINGHYAGELCDAQPLMRPVSPRGAVILDYRPLQDDVRPMARRLVFSGGAPLQESAEEAEGLNIVLWPGGAVEIELTPRQYLPSRQVFNREGFNFMLEGGPEPKLHCEGSLLASLPEGADMPRMHRLREGVALIGSCRDGMYLATADSALQHTTGFLRAREIEIRSDERIHALVAPGDTAGHSTREQWLLAHGGLQLLSSESGWEQGAPRWPQDPENTAIAAVEAALAGLEEELEGYLTPRLHMQRPLDNIQERCDLCVRLKYAPPDGLPCVGLLRLEGSNLARVSPLGYSAVRSDGRPWPWQIDGLEFG